MRRYNIPLDVDDLVKRYIAGESEKTLAIALGVDRRVIRNRLVRAGVEPRNRAAAMRVRMGSTSSEERRRLTSGANAAALGSHRSADQLASRAAAIERQGAANGNVSRAEVMLAGMLRGLGLEVIHQKAIGPYNADLASGTVAVEVLGGQWHNAKKHGERLRYILDAGWDVIFVWVTGRSSPLEAGAAEYIAAHCQVRDGDPAAPRCYRVIRGGGQLVAEGRADRDDIPDVLPISRHPD